MKYSKYIKKLVLFLSFCFASLIVLAVLFVYPNDKRIKIIPPKPTKLKQEFILLNGLNNFQINYSNDIPNQVYQSHLKKLKNDYTNTIELNSHRFTHPLEFLISLGSYPDRLDARKAFLIPTGKSLSIKISNKSERIKFGGVSFNQPSSLEIKKNKQLVKLIKLNKATTPRDINDFWYKNVLRFINPDSLTPGGRWDDFDEPLRLDNRDTLELTCIGEGSCIVSNIEFYAKRQSNKNNTILIVIDTMRFDAITKFTSPHLFLFKQKNIVFDHMYALGNMTSPSTNTMLSCQKPNKVEKIISYGIPKEDQESYYKENKPSFASQFKKHGWKTGMIGNISVISDVLGVGIDHGFDDKISIERDGYDTPQITREALNWIDNNKQHPFFLYLHYHSPHAPYKPPFFDIKETFKDVKDFDSYSSILKWLYRGEIHYTDRYIHLLFENLKNLNLYDKTNIIISADHGDHHEVRTFNDNEQGFSFTGTYFDHGATLYEDEIRVPLILKLVDNKHPQIVHTPVSGLDIAPTLLDLSNIQKPNWCDGQSILKYAHINKDQKKTNFEKSLIGFIGFHRQGILFEHKYKYIRQYSPVDKKVFYPDSFLSDKQSYYSKELLFNIEEDQKETENLAGTNASLLQKARQQYRRYFDIKLEFQLVIDNFSKHEVQIHYPNAPKVTTNEEYFIHRNENLKKNILPNVTINGKKIEIKFTSAKVANITDLSKLPVENEYSETLIKSKKPSAYIRKIELSKYKDDISSQFNPAFKQIMKEWGYLTEN